MFGGQDIGFSVEYTNPSGEKSVSSTMMVRLIIQCLLYSPPFQPSIFLCFVFPFCFLIPLFNIIVFLQ